MQYTIRHPKTQAQLQAIEKALDQLGSLRMTVPMDAWPSELCEARAKLHKAHDSIIRLAKQIDARKVHHAT